MQMMMSSGDPNTYTCGDFTVTPTTPGWGNVSGFLSTSRAPDYCAIEGYVRPNGYGFTISCTTPFVVSSGDIISVRVGHDGDAGLATLWLIMPGEPNLAIGSGLGDCGSWYPCNDPAIWRTVTLTTSGTITGLIVTGGRGSDAYGIGQLKVNGYIIYSGATYKSGIN